MDVGLRRRAHQLLRVGRTDDPASRWLNAGILGLIIANILAMILETVAPLAARYGAWFGLFELFSVVLFSVEYIARLWAAPEQATYRHPVVGRLRWSVTPLALIDLLAILPFYLVFLPGLDLRVLRALRIFRLARVLKLARYSTALQTMARVFARKRQELVLTLFAVGILMVLAASLMYMAEHRAQPEAFGSIPETLWWAVITLTTVGYGDTFPITPIGRVLGAVTAILGIGLVALPAGILGGGFVEELQRQRDEELPTICPHCGHDVRMAPEDLPEGAA